MNAINFKRKNPPEDAVVPDIEGGYLKHQYLLVLVVPYSK
jgi:hypothetical protein